jgi:hypothetical protein
MQLCTWNTSEKHTKVSRIMKHVYTYFYTFLLFLCQNPYVWSDLVHLLKRLKSKNHSHNQTFLTYCDKMAVQTPNILGNRNDAWETVVHALAPIHVVFWRSRNIVRKQTKIRSFK